MSLVLRLTLNWEDQRSDSQHRSVDAKPSQVSYVRPAGGTSPADSAGERTSLLKLGIRKSQVVDASQAKTTARPVSLLRHLKRGTKTRRFEPTSAGKATSRSVAKRRVRSCRCRNHGWLSRLCV